MAQNDKRSHSVAKVESHKFQGAQGNLAPGGIHAGDRGHSDLHRPCRIIEWFGKWTTAGHARSDLWAFHSPFNAGLGRSSIIGRYALFVQQSHPIELVACGLAGREFFGLSYRAMDRGLASLVWLLVWAVGIFHATLRFHPQFILFDSACRQWRCPLASTPGCSSRRVHQDGLSVVRRAHKICRSKYRTRNSVSKVPEKHHPAGTEELENVVLLLPRAHRISLPRHRRKNALPALQHGHHLKGTRMNESTRTNTNQHGKNFPLILARGEGWVRSRVSCLLTLPRAPFSAARNRHGFYTLARRTKIWTAVAEHSGDTAFVRIGTAQTATKMRCVKVGLGFRSAQPPSNVGNFNSPSAANVAENQFVNIREIRVANF